MTDAMWAAMERARAVEARRRREAVQAQKALPYDQYVASLDADRDAEYAAMMDDGPDGGE